MDVSGVYALKQSRRLSVVREHVSQNRHSSSDFSDPDPEGKVFKDNIGTVKLQGL